MIRNTPRQWGRAARWLHWLMALMIAAQVPLGFWMVDAYDAWLAGNGDTALVMNLSRAHNTNGFGADPRDGAAGVAHAEPDARASGRAGCGSD